MERTLIPYLGAGIVNYIGYAHTTTTSINVWILPEYWIGKMSVSRHYQEKAFQSSSLPTTRTSLNYIRSINQSSFSYITLKKLHSKQAIEIMRTKFQNSNQVLTNLDHNIPNFKIRTVIDANIAAKSLSKINRSAKQIASPSNTKISDYKITNI